MEDLVLWRGLNVVKFSHVQLALESLHPLLERRVLIVTTSDSRCPSHDHRDGDTVGVVITGIGASARSWGSSRIVTR